MVDFHGAPHKFIQDHDFIQVTSTLYQNIINKKGIKKRHWNDAE